MPATKDGKKAGEAQKAFLCGFTKATASWGAEQKVQNPFHSLLSPSLRFYVCLTDLSWNRLFRTQSSYPPKENCRLVQCPTVVMRSAKQVAGADQPFLLHRLRPMVEWAMVSSNSAVF